MVAAPRKVIPAVRREAVVDLKMDTIATLGTWELYVYALEVCPRALRTARRLREALLYCPGLLVGVFAFPPGEHAKRHRRLAPALTGVVRRPHVACRELRALRHLILIALLPDDQPFRVRSLRCYVILTGLGLLLSRPLTQVLTQLLQQPAHTHLRVFRHRVRFPHCCCRCL